MGSLLGGSRNSLNPITADELPRPIIGQGFPNQGAGIHKSVQIDPVKRGHQFELFRVMLLKRLALLSVLEEYHQQVDSRWMFPSPVKEDSPLDPATVRKRLQTILEHAGCKRVRFHDLRHLFVTTALENGIDVKTLSTIIGHVSTKTTLNVYTHVTDTMRQAAAAKIDRGIAKCEPPDDPGEGLPAKTSNSPSKAPFEPYTGKIRKPGTGCVTQINDHLWEGKFSPKWPDGKKHSHSIYASTKTDCEEKLVGLIRQMKAEVAEAKRLAAGGKWKAAMALATQKKARGTRKIELLS